MYTDLAPWFHLLTHPSDYREEAEFVTRVADEVVEGRAETLLELGSGGGNNASHLKARFDCTLTDLSPDMLALSEGLNPECEHIQGDMRTLRLGRTFDVVFIHDAVSYLTTEDDLRAAVETAAAHVSSRRRRHPHARRDDRDLRAANGSRRARRGRRPQPSLLEWIHPRTPGTSTYTVDYVIALQGPGAAVRDRPRPPCPRGLSVRDLAPTPGGGRAGGRRHHGREPVRARAGGVRRTTQLRLTPSGRISTLGVEHTFVPEPWRARC